MHSSNKLIVNASQSLAERTPNHKVCAGFAICATHFSGKAEHSIFRQSREGARLDAEYSSAAATFTLKQVVVLWVGGWL